MIRDSASKTFSFMPGKASVAGLPNMGSVVMAFVFDVWHNAFYWQSCNAYSLSNATGIPRETVRRKASELVKRGWVRRDERGGFLVAPEASKHFSADFNVRSLRDLFETADELRMILESDASPNK